MILYKGPNEKCRKDLNVFISKIIKNSFSIFGKLFNAAPYLTIKLPQLLYGYKTYI